MIPYTAAHLNEPIWDSADEHERMLPRLLWHLHTPYARTWCVDLESRH